jgi:hypothetical protein
MIAALDSAFDDPTKVKRRRAMAATIDERGSLARRLAKENDGMVANRPRQRFG